MEKFDPLEDFIEDLEKEFCPRSVPMEQIRAADKWRRTIARMRFGKELNKLGDFITCDKEGKPLDKPKEEMFYKAKDSTQSWGDYLSKQYSEALERVVFEGFELVYSSEYSYLLRRVKGSIIEVRITKDPLRFRELDSDKDLKTREDLSELGLTLTKSGSKQMRKL